MNAEIIRPRKSSSVRLGSTVQLKSAKKEVTYTIVGAVEANPVEGKISDKSPIGQALIGKKQDEEVCITTPKGETTYTISSIS
jgi:transcription elongation GreA/GreB family factor